MKKQVNKKRVFKLKELKYTDLDGNVITFEGFDNKAFARGLFNSINSPDSDLFVREMFDKGESELTEEVENWLDAVINPLWGYRACESIRELINNTK